MWIIRSREESWDLNNRDKLIQLLGLAQRAGKIISGEEQVLKAIRSNKASLVFLAQDAGPNLSKKITDKSNYYTVEVSTVLTTLELSTALGKPRKVTAVADAGFSKKMRTLMG